MNIYVSNLAITTTTHDLRQLFEPYGVVDRVRIITDRDTGRCKGFGFVEMPDSQAAHAAIVGLRGQDLAGRTLTVNEAKAQGSRREPRQAG
jgi:RNA recognition motif-containing protein